MPLFEYHCEACKKTFEKMSKQLVETVPCPDCGQLAPKIVSSIAASPSCAAPSGSGFG